MYLCANSRGFFPEYRWRRQASALQEVTSSTPNTTAEDDLDKGSANSFRSRLNAIEMR